MLNSAQDAMTNTAPKDIWPVLKVSSDINIPCIFKHYDNRGSEKRVLCLISINFKTSLLNDYENCWLTGGNMTEALTTTLRAGYREQCGGYVLLLSNSDSVTDLLHYGDDLRMINTRARYCHPLIQFIIPLVCYCFLSLFVNTFSNTLKLQQGNN